MFWGNCLARLAAFRFERCLSKPLQKAEGSCTPSLIRATFHLTWTANIPPCSSSERSGTPARTLLLHLERLNTRLYIPPRRTQAMAFQSPSGTTCFLLLQGHKTSPALFTYFSLFFLQVFL